MCNYHGYDGFKGCDRHTKASGLGGHYSYCVQNHATYYCFFMYILNLL